MTCFHDLGLTLEVSFEDVKRERDVVNLIFRHRRSRGAARALIEWLKDRGGSCTHTEMNEFSHLLASGKLGCSLSRTNFYGTVLKRLMGLCLIVEQPQFDYETRKVLKVYRIVVQPIGKRKPVGPSLLLLSYEVCAKWNEEFTRR